MDLLQDKILSGKKSLGNYDENVNALYSNFKPQSPTMFIGC